MQVYMDVILRETFWFSNVMCYEWEVGSFSYKLTYHWTHQWNRWSRPLLVIRQNVVYCSTYEAFFNYILFDIHKRFCSVCLVKLERYHQLAAEPFVFLNKRPDVCGWLFCPFLKNELLEFNLQTVQHTALIKLFKLISNHRCLFDWIWQNVTLSDSFL